MKQDSRIRTSSRFSRGCAGVATLLCLAAVAPAGASITDGAVISGGPGATFIVLPVPFTESTPDNTVGDNNFNTPHLYGFNEDQNIVLAAPLRADRVASGPLTLPAGTVVASHYIFFDPVDGDIDGTVDFDANVIAIISSTGNLLDSDFLAHTGVSYLNPSLRGIESGDSVVISGPRQIRFRASASDPGDYVRVLTSLSPPDLLSCAYPFTAGSGASQIRFCVSANGTIVQLGSPSGQEHVAVGEVWEGYVVCSGTSVLAWELTGSADAFGAPTVTAGPTSTGISINRASFQFSLDQAFKLDKNEKDITITMTLRNTSATTLTDVRIARAYDPDPDNDFGDDLEVASARGVWASDVNAVTLTGISWPVPTSTAFNAPALPACSAVGSGVPTTTGDASLASVSYRLGDIKAGAKKAVKFVYRAE